MTHQKQAALDISYTWNCCSDDSLPRLSRNTKKTCSFQNMLSRVALVALINFDC